MPRSADILRTSKNAMAFGVQASSLRWLALQVAVVFATVEVGIVPGAPLDVVPEVVKASSFEEVHAAVRKLKVNKLSSLGPCWFASQDGVPIKSWEDILALAPENRNFSAVPMGRLYQRRPGVVGHRQQVQLSDRQGVQLETVSTSPRVFLLHNFFSTEEADAILESALQQTGTNALSKSGVGFKTVGRREHGLSRTSDNAFDQESPAAMTLVRRAFEVVKVPYDKGFQDGLQILRYQPGQAYISHTDWFDTSISSNAQNFDTSKKDGSNRWATVFFYLKAPPSGGFTVFPEAHRAENLKDTDIIHVGKNTSRKDAAMEEAKRFYGSRTWEVDLVEACFSKLAIKPVELGALLFYHQDPLSGKLLAEAKHGACPSFTGTKWGANLWIWNAPRHLTPQNQVQAKFVNREVFAADLQYSMDHGESWVQFATIGIGSASSASTYGGHWWRLLKQGSPEEVQRWVVPNKINDATFMSDGTVQNEL